MNKMQQLVVSAVAALGATIVAPAFAQATLETAPAEYRSVPREFVLDGAIEAVNRSTVSAQVSARVTAVHFDVDDFVEQGTLIVEFDDTEYRASLREATAAREAAAASLDAARAHFERIASLRERNTASQAEFDQARAQRDAARAELNAADAVIARIEQQLAYTRVRAPYSGIVTARHIELGETANPGTPLMSGFSLARLRAVVQFPQRLFTTAGTLDGARVEVPGRTDGISAEDITVFPYAAAQTGTIAVRVVLPEGIEGIFPGMLVKVAFPVGERLRLSVPAAALVYRSEVTGVYVVDADGRASFRHVRAGDTDENGTVEILAGLDEGEQVAIDPARAMTRTAGAATR